MERAPPSSSERVHWAARRGLYRIIYALDEDPRTVTVLAVAHRVDVYRPAALNRLLCSRLDHDGICGGEY
jgi:hypothetical protein